MHVKVVAGSLQIDERRRPEADLAIKHLGPCGFHGQLSLGQSETCRQRLRLVPCYPHALEMHVTYVGDMPWLDGPGNGNLQSSRPPQVDRISQREGLWDEPQRQRMPDLPGEMHLESATQLNV